MFNFIFGLIIGGGVVWYTLKRGMDSRLRGNDRGGEDKKGPVRTKPYGVIFSVDDTNILANTEVLSRVITLGL